MGFVILTVMDIAVLLIESTLFSYNAEAKRKPSQINVYVTILKK
jgi:hypothetical protein